ncbi:hypothetical protein N7G274_009003 [Stereocaulon virgatum]|uniref:Uncharacterized protein n=1 Tax=Stereocaulon virgatum TaxID=373712 RepID=A0ABR3ZXF2_9LECA
MSLKRKRSTSAISPSTSSTATTSSRDPSSSPSPDISMLGNASVSPPPVHHPESTSSHLHSRTRKRFRDNRPDESTIHETTYNKLFAAARSPPPLSYSISPSTSISPARPQPPQRQHSLHNFWSLPSSAPSVSHPMTIVPSSGATCEDCEASLDVDVFMGGMDDEDAKGAEFGCQSCGKRVCGMCAVVEVGVGRECLHCRTSSRKKWVGGIGWMS